MTLIEKFMTTPRDEWLKVLRDTEEEETDRFMEQVKPLLKKDYDKGIPATFDDILDLCRSMYSCGLSAGLNLGMPG